MQEAARIWARIWFCGVVWCCAVRCGILEIGVVKRRGIGRLANSKSSRSARSEAVEGRGRDDVVSVGVEGRSRRCSVGGCKGVDSARPSCAAEQEQQRQRQSWGRTSGLFEARQSARPRPPLKKEAFSEKCQTTPAQFKQFPSQILKSYTSFLLTAQTQAKPTQANLRSFSQTCERRTPRRFNATSPVSPARAMLPCAPRHGTNKSCPFRLLHTPLLRSAIPVVEMRAGHRALPLQRRDHARVCASLSRSALRTFPPVVALLLPCVCGGDRCGQTSDSIYLFV